MGAYVPIVSYVSLSQLPGVMVPAFPTAGTPPPYAPDTNKSEIYQLNQPLAPQSFPKQYWSLTGTEPQQQVLLCGTVTAPAPKIDFVGTQFSVPVGNANFPTSPMHCALAINNNSCSQILYQPTQAAGNMTQNWQPGLPLTIEGTGFGFLPEMTLPYATTGWAGPTTSYLTITDTPSGGAGTPWTSPNQYCQMLILNWSPTTITVVPNVETHMYDGSLTLVSPLTDTSPFSLVASTSCPVISGDSISVTVFNPQANVSYTTMQPLAVNTFTGQLH